MPDRRISPPPDLPERVKRAFLEVVSSCPSSQFQQSDVELLCRWSESVVMAQEARTQLTATGMVGPDGKKSAWVSIYQTAVRNQTLLAMRLRLSPQSRMPRAPKTQAKPMSVYDEMTLLRSDDDGEGEETAQ
jgi:hypothetical protein